jgi:hypothetical protein
LMKAGAKINAPLEKVAPLTAVAAKEGVERWNVMPPPRPGADEQVFGTRLATDDGGNAQVLVSELTDGEAVGLRFGRNALPCFTVWRNTPAEADGYVLGIEPGTNYPNPRTFEDEQGRVVRLKPGEIWQANVTATWYSDQQAIADEHRAIQSQQATQKPELAQNPIKGWSAGA